MTQLSPKPGSQHFKNGRGSYSKATPVDGRTSATNYSSSASRRGQSSLESKAIQFPSSEEILPYAQTPKLAVQQRNWLRWLSASLRVKTTLAAIAIGALPVITIGAVSYITSSQQFRQQIIQNEQTNILDLKDKLFYFMKERAGDAETLANLPVFIEPKLREVFKREDQEDALNRFARAYQIYDSIALVDLQGNVLAQSQSETLPNLYNQDYFQAVLKTDRLYISEPAVSVSSKVYSLFVAAPVKDAVT
ncbi:MAG TPA: chemotaxis protein, partial [Cyanophyceae cyanobacterium]